MRCHPEQSLVKGQFFLSNSGGAETKHFVQFPLKDNLFFHCLNLVRLEFRFRAARSVPRKTEIEPLSDIPPCYIGSGVPSMAVSQPWSL